MTKKKNYCKNIFGIIDNELFRRGQVVMSIVLAKGIDFKICPYKLFSFLC